MDKYKEMFYDDTVRIVGAGLVRGLGKDLTDEEVIEALKGNFSEKVKDIVNGLCENVTNVMLVRDAKTNAFPYKSLCEKESVTADYVESFQYDFIAAVLLVAIRYKRGL